MAHIENMFYCNVYDVSVYSNDVSLKIAWNDGESDGDHQVKFISMSRELAKSLSKDIKQLLKQSKE